MERDQINEVVDAAQWRGVIGHETTHEVSSDGRVRTLDREFKRRPSRRHPEGWVQVKRGKLSKLTRTNTGHMVVNIGGKIKLVHRLMLEAFVGPCPPRHEGLHADDVPDNNVLPNLRWGTRSDNVKDAIRNGRRSTAWGRNQK